MFEYQKKEAAILLIAETLNPISLRELAERLEYIAADKEAEQEVYEND